jgi:hypothetical protein
MRNRIGPTIANGRSHAHNGLLDGSDVAAADSLAPTAVRAWLRGDAESVARLNQAKAEQTERLRAQVQELAGQAVATLRELVTNADTPPAIRLRAALAVLAASDALKLEPVGPLTAGGVRATWEHRELLESLAG